MAGQLPWWLGIRMSRKTSVMNNSASFIQQKLGYFGY
jgi:hypothetical protein